MTTSMKNYMMQTNLYAAQAKIEDMSKAMESNFKAMHAMIDRIEALERRCAQLELESRQR